MQSARALSWSEATKMNIQNSKKNIKTKTARLQKHFSRPYFRYVRQISPSLRTSCAFHFGSREAEQALSSHNVLCICSPAGVREERVLAPVGHVGVVVAMMDSLGPVVRC